VVPDDASGHVHASVDLVGEIAKNFADDLDLYAAVGGGTINDMTKDLAHRRGRPYLAVATAASMNGYTSSIVSLLERGLKTTRPSTPPLAVLADPDLLCEAPVELTRAGLGDLVSKPYSGCDWWIACVIRNEPYCPTPGRILDESFDDALEILPRVGEQDSQAVVLLFKLLVVSGVTMTIAGASSPASGGEHLLSHYWDMINLRDGRPLRLHGAQVGVASLAMDALYSSVFDTAFAQGRCASNPNDVEERAAIERVFGSLAGAVWPQWEAKLAHPPERDAELLAEHQNRIKEKIRQVLASGRQIRQALRASGAPMWAAELDISTAELERALRHGRKIRNRYTVLDVAAELGVLDTFAADYPLRGISERDS
jgi:glycerol-1-phosphate dehydrogenase [NAD(P)+]